MKHVIRRSVFDTNSSTMHTCVIMTEDKYNDWENNDLYYYNGDCSWAFDDLPNDKKPEVGGLYTLDEVINFYNLTKYGYDEQYEDEYDTPEEAKDAYIREMGYFIKCETFFDNEYLESDTTHYTTPGGEKIVVCCQYGTDY